MDANLTLALTYDMFNQGLIYFLEALKSIGDSWMMSQDSLDIFKCDLSPYKENINSEQRGILHIILGCSWQHSLAGICLHGGKIKGI